MDRENKIKIIYIAGLGRSGSTLLDLIMSTSDKVFSVGEIYNFNNIMRRDAECGCGENVSNCNFWGTFHQKKDYVNVVSRISILNYLKILSFLYNPFSKKRIFTDNPEVNYGLLKKISKKAFPNNSGYILDASKDLGRLIELSSDERFDVYCIHLIRDIRGVANSYSSKKRKSSQNFLITTSKWIVANTLIRRFLKKGKLNKMSISYNLFCENPNKYINAINSFLGSDIPKKFPEIVRSMEYHNIGGNRISKKDKRVKFEDVKTDLKWKQEMSVLKKGFVSFVCAPLIKRWVLQDDVIK